ncbi:hypothetical protein DNHGIG_02370 [Collibacillus ludicampi]|uniref:YncE family protein n=1 Tax=Collibacillus ludicampi TaxID=2771369 RepID=A0AAV4LAG5_9BACL|nr:hypothetical protein [Collibacillus ludicampi]GIM44688.1 hypothetical protein DNHGIG_02370 [Collibacillus ludicampi]
MLNKVWVLPLSLFFLVACSSSSHSLSTTTDGHSILYVSDSHKIDIVDVDTNKNNIINNSIFIQSLNYDKEKKRIVAPGYSPEEKFLGLLFVEGTDLKKKSTSPFAPIHLYQYGNTYVMDSAQVLKDGKIDITQIGVYNSSTESMIKLLQVPGIVKDIIGFGSKAYISSYLSPESTQNEGVPPKSNIYELDLHSYKLRPIFHQDQKFVPFRLLFHDGYLYGVYQSANNVPIEAPQNQLIKIDPQKGVIEKTVQLPIFAKDMTLSSDGKSIFVTHFDQWGSQDLLEKPLSKVDLSTFQVDELTYPIRAVSLVSLNGKLYVGNSIDRNIVVIDEKTFKVEKTIQAEIPAMYMVKN